MEQADFRFIESPDQGVCIRIIEYKPAQIPKGVLQGEDIEFGSREKIEVMGESMPDVESAACASGKIERLQEILSGKKL